MTSSPLHRIRRLNSHAIQTQGKYVLYWMQMYRRLSHNHAIDYAIQVAKESNKPLVIYEGLKKNYPWANVRIHTFMLQGMMENCETAKSLGIHYWPFVETREDSGRGLVRKLCEQACILITDDYPQFIVPAHNQAISQSVRIPVHAVDGNCVVPLSLLGKPTAAAAHLRPKIHKLFLESWENRSQAQPQWCGLAESQLEPPFALWTPPADLAEFVGNLGIDTSVPAVPGFVGGSAPGRQLLQEFVEHKLHRYATERSQPDDPARISASGLSPYLHYGHLSIDEVIEATLGKSWQPSDINLKTRNKDDFFCRDANVNGFLDEAITWRDVGYQWHYQRLLNIEIGTRSWVDDSAQSPSFNFATFDFSPRTGAGTLTQTLPEWALASLQKHIPDDREYQYSLEEFESGATHDPLWNAAQRELVATGRMHNYMRMLWGKKVLEWSETPEAAYQVLEHLNNKYAIDGRDPNSYTGILWCFGLFDRPWPPERQVFGNIRFMSSASTAKKFKLKGYLEYIQRLPTINQVRSGERTVTKAGSLF